MSSDGSGRTSALDRRNRFERIYGANYELILGYAARRTSTTEDAADVVAETFLTAWRRLDDIPDPPESRLWLYGTARRVLANHRRGQRRYERLGARLRAGAVSPPPATETAAVATGDAVPAIAAAFGRLTDSDRELLALVAWEGLSGGEAARVLGCSTGTARVRLYRARARFARELAAEGIEGVTRAGRRT